MCGISGLADFNRAVALENYYPAHLRLRHRGRDDEGFFALSGGKSQGYRGDDTIAAFNGLPHIGSLKRANVVLGNRRLAIIDLSPGGHQPMMDPSGRYAMVYNGEVFNYVELRQELAASGHHFQSQSDAEVLLAAFARWGIQCFNHLNGMWALAIYDLQQRRLILSRDRFGIKPLYYALINGTLYFGSEAKFILPFLSSLKVNEARALDYLVHSVVDHHRETMFKGIYQLLPAHYAIFDRAGLTQQAYWQLPTRHVRLSLAEAGQQLSELLSSAVSLRMRSDVPIGSLLSGGLDSATIVCTVRRLLDRQKATNAFDCFSAVFHEEQFSERCYAEKVIAQTGLPIHWIYPDPEKLMESLPHLLHYQEFPFRSLAVYSQWEIMRQVNQTPIVVLLDGQGSDEIFAGYTAHYYALIAEYLRRLRLMRAWRESRALAQVRYLSASQSLQQALKALGASVLKRSGREVSLPYLNRAYRPAQGWVQQRDFFQNALVRNLTFSALPEYLRYEDRNSMAFTLESRLPFMDYRIVEWAMSLPAELKISKAISKLVLRESAKGFIPTTIIERRDKMGFVSPQEEWQRGVLAPLLDKVLASDLQARFPFLDGKQVRMIYRAYQAGQNDNWAWVWRVACLTWWQQYWFEDKMDYVN